MMEDKEWIDEVLTRALGARPEHVPTMDVAGVAMARARAQEERVARLARISFWTRVCSVAAVLLVVGTVAVAYWEWPTSTSSTTSGTTDSSGSGYSSDSTSASSSVDMTTVGAGAFVLALLAVGGLMVLTPERPTWRLSPA